VCLDLEDAVSPHAKDGARQSALDFLGANGEHAARIALRLNETGSEHGLRDVQALCDLGRAPAALLLPKVRSSDEVRGVRDRLANWLLAPRLIPLIETADGLTHAIDIARAVSDVEALLFGGADLSAELGCALDWEPLLYARSRVVHAAAAAGVTSIDMPWLATNDAQRLQQECARARSLGFTGKAAIHPNQIAAIHDAFTPAQAEIEWAHRVIDAANASDEGVVLLNGRMIDAAVVRAARRMLSLAQDTRAAP
jgi:citrate lyase beta subunit